MKANEKERLKLTNCHMFIALGDTIDGTTATIAEGIRDRVAHR